MTSQKKKPAGKFSGVAVEEMSPTPNDFWKQKGIEELSEEQGVEPIAKLEQVLGKGSELWDSDEDFELFLAGINERRNEERQ